MRRTARRRWIALVGVAAVLTGSACSDDDAASDDPAVTDPVDGADPTDGADATDDPGDEPDPDDTTTTAGDPQPAELPAGFPAHIPLPVGASLESAAETASGGDTIYSVTFTTSEAAAEVFEDVVDAFLGAGFVESNRSGNQTNDTFSGSADLADDQHLVTVNVRSAGDGTVIGYFVGPAPR